MTQQQIQTWKTLPPQTVSREINVVARPAGELAIAPITPAMAAMIGLIVGALIGWAISQQMKESSK